MPSTNTQMNQGHGLSLTRDETLASRLGDDRDDGIKTASASENHASANLPDNDAASTIARSTFSGYSEQKYLLSNGRRTSLQQGSQKTVSRKAYLGVCKAVDVFIPIDINREVTCMHDSSLARLARVVKKNERPSPHDRNIGPAGRRSI